MAHTFFDESYYLTVNSDVAAAVSRGVFTSGLQHYELFGAREQRNASAEFNTAYYSFWNADVQTAINQGAFRSPVDHFDQFGVAENRGPNAVLAEFDTARYLSDNPDVNAAVSAGMLRSALEHYLVFGEGEERQAFTKSGGQLEANPPPAANADEHSVELTGIASSQSGGDAGGM